MSKLENNTTSLQAILKTVNNLPSASVPIKTVRVGFSTDGDQTSSELYFVDASGTFRTLTKLGEYGDAVGGFCIFKHNGQMAYYIDADGNTLSDVQSALLMSKTDSSIRRLVCNSECWIRTLRGGGSN